MTLENFMRHCTQLITLLILLAPPAPSQTDGNQVGRLLEPRIQTPEATASELQRYLAHKVPKLSLPGDAAQFSQETRRMRQRLLDDVVLQGWPREWVNSSLKVEDLGLIPSGKGYRMRKLRFEVLPGLQSTAILYEPEAMRGKVPAILNVHGHTGLPGKALEYKQKRCINQALQGILALSVEWLGYGELSHPENQHWFAGHLDLVGSNGVGVFYLTVRKALDYLYQHPAVDQGRLGMTGLSGGGWQTILLSALDDRVAVAVPVAGYAPYLYRLARIAEAGDLEQNPTDMFASLDYSHLTAFRAPRPTLLIYNAEDNCCWRAPLIKPLLFDAAAPYFRLYGAEDRFAWHENTDPADHNYQLDNRMQSYRFFAKHFGLRDVEKETSVSAELKSAEELPVGVPKDNLTLLGLARKLAGRIERPAASSGDAGLLRRTVRFPRIDVSRAWAVANSKRAGLESISYRFEFNDGLSATGVWLKAIDAPENAPGTIVLHDAGKKASRAEASDRVNRGEQVLVVDLLLTGDMAPPEPPGRHPYTQLLATFGERALGIEAAQLAAIAQWLSQSSQSGTVRLETTGIRSQVTALVAGAIFPKLFTQIVIGEGMPSLRHLLDAPVDYRSAPDLFCLNLYKDFDLEQLVALSAPTRIVQSYAVSPSK